LLRIWGWFELNKTRTSLTNAERRHSNALTLKRTFDCLGAGAALEFVGSHEHQNHHPHRRRSSNRKTKCCNDCHTPKIPGPNGAPAPDTSKLLSGNPESMGAPSWSPEDVQAKGVVAATNASLTVWAGPWGFSFALNLTPDKNTGNGEWMEEMFIKMAEPASISASRTAATFCPDALVQYEGFNRR
jgi:hypothetical protein